MLKSKEQLYYCPNMIGILQEKLRKAQKFQQQSRHIGTQCEQLVIQEKQKSMPVLIQRHLLNYMEAQSKVMALLSQI